MWRVSGIVAVVMGFLLPTRAVAQEPQNPCAVPDALVEAGEEDEARKEYVALLKAAPATTCASQGLKELNAPTPTADTPSCDDADDAFDAGDLEAARTEYERIGRDQECAEAGLAAIREVERWCRQGQAHLALEREEDATTAFRSALEKNPNAECALAGLEELAPGFIDEVADLTPEALLWLAVILLASLLLLAILGRSREIYAFLLRDPILRPLIRPRLTISPLDDSALPAKVGASFAARMKERLQRFREEALATGEEAGDYELDFGSVDEDFAELVSQDSKVQTALSKLGGLSERTKVIGGLIDLLYTFLPGKKLAISGACEPPDANRAAATLLLEEDSRLVASTELAGPNLAKAANAGDYLALADPAAVWAQYIVAQALSDGRVDADRAESYALLRKGLDYHLAGKAVEARAAYREALDHNPENWAARVNLAVTEAHLAQRFRIAIEILVEALVDMTGRRRDEV